MLTGLSQHFSTWKRSLLLINKGKNSKNTNDFTTNHIVLTDQELQLVFRSKNNWSQETVTLSLNFYSKRINILIFKQISFQQSHKVMEIQIRQNIQIRTMKIMINMIKTIQQETMLLLNSMLGTHDAQRRTNVSQGNCD